MIDQVYVDLHGVLADFVRPWACTSGHSMPKPWPAGRYSLEDAFGVESHRIWDAILPESSEWWATLPATDEADQVLAIAGGVAPVRIVTSPRSPLTIRHHEAAGSTRLVAERYAAQVEILEWKGAISRPGLLLIDDSDDQVREWRKHGGRAVVMPRPWNSEHRHAADPIGRLRSQLRELDTPAGGCFSVDLPLPPEALDPNRRPKSHALIRREVRRYRTLCCDLVRARLLEYRTPAPRWTRYRIASTWRTESGRSHDMTNAVAWAKAGEDALQICGIVRNDRSTIWDPPRFERTGSPLGTGLRLTVLSTDQETSR